MFKNNKKRKKCLNDRCKEAIDRRNRVREKTNKDESDINIERYKNIKKVTNKVLRKNIGKNERLRKLKKIEITPEDSSARVQDYQH